MPQSPLERFLGLPVARQRAVERALCDRALKVWCDWIGAQPELNYIDTAIGAEHRVEAGLPEAALACVYRGASCDEVGVLERRYLEPLSALRDGDLQVPEAVRCAWFAIYHLFRRQALQVEIPDHLILEQALSACVETEGPALLLCQVIESLHGG